MNDFFAESVYPFVESKGFLLVAFIVFLAAIEVGYWIAGLRPAGKTPESRAIVGAIVMLLALILTFMVSEAAETWRQTIQLIQRETDAMGETFRRSLLLDPPERAQVAESVRNYVREKIRVGHSDSGAISTLHRDLWDEMRQVQKAQGDSSNSQQMFAAANRMMDLHWRTDLNIRQRIPLAIALLSMGGVVLVSFLVGYSTGSAGSRAWVMRLTYLGMVMLTLNSIRSLGALRSGVRSETQRNQQAFIGRVEGWE